MTELIIGVVGAVLGCTTLVTAILYWSQSRRIKNAEARARELETELQEFGNYKQQLAHANEIIHLHNESMLEQAETIHKLNTQVGDKTERIRKLTDDLIKSESKTNRQNDKLLKLQEENAQLKRDLILYKDWHCRRDCNNRLPENPKIKGKSFDECKLALVCKKNKKV